MTAEGWTIRLRTDQDLVTGGITSNAKIAIEHESGYFLLGVSRLQGEKLAMDFPARDDIHITLHSGSAAELTWLGTNQVDVDSRNGEIRSLQPGENHVLKD